MRARRTSVAGLLLSIVLLLLSFSAPRARAQAVFDPLLDVFWEYGAESGEIRPPWDQAVPSSQISLVNSQARSGTKSIKLYQPPPTKSDIARRVMLKEWDTKFEYYASFWAYFPDVLIDSDMQYEWTGVGRVGAAWFQAKDGSYWYRTGLGLCLDHGSSLNERSLKITWLEPFKPISNQESRRVTLHGWLNSSNVNTWIHFQVYCKWSNSMDGHYKVWIDNELKADWTGMVTDPRGYWQWANWNCEFMSEQQPMGYFALYNYQEKSSPESWIFYDDVVLSDTKVPETYRVGYQWLEFESWENGFEESNLSAWNGTETGGSGITPSTVTLPTYQGSYAANFSTSSGAIGSYSRAKHEIRDVTEVYQRSYVRYATLPDTNDTNMWVVRIGQKDDSWIASAGILMLNGNYYWYIREVGGAYNYTLDSGILTDIWYSVEFYFNATTKGNAILWINDVEKCEMSGDFSGYTITRVYPYIYIGGGLDDVGDQASGKTVYHDNYRVDRDRISVARGTLVFQTSAYLSTSVEGEPVRFSTLEGVRINGTKLTDASGYYEWADLACNEFYTFVIEKPAGYYMAWVLNVEGSYTRNGTHYILRHNVTETQTGSIEIYFSRTEEVNIKSSTHKLTSVFYNSSSQNPHTFMRLKIAADIGATSRLEIYTADEGHPRPYKIEGATDWSYDSLDEILTVWILHTNEEEAEIEWRGAAMGQ